VSATVKTSVVSGDVDFKSKAEVRAHVRAQWPSALPLAALYKNLSQVLDHQKGSWAAFKALSDEPPLEGVLSPHLTWVFPRLHENELEFLKPQSWVKSRYGFMEPQEGEKIPKEQIQGFLVPGVAFSRSGQRIGRGQGYYDRALAGTKSLKVGVCYSFQVFSQLPVESHDINMDVVVTDREILWLTRS